MDVAQKVKVFKESHSGSKTSLLWLQYMHTIEILLRFLKAESSSNWMLYLQTVCEMMSFFAASWHCLYEKSSYMYLQGMLRLPKTQPGVQRMCQNGFHTIRRSDKFWHELFSDLVIEQALMRRVKTRLPRGCGTDELSTPVTAEVNRITQESTRVKYQTSNQRNSLKSANHLTLIQN